jgi:hypothetical protein
MFPRYLESDLRTNFFETTFENQREWNIKLLRITYVPDYNSAILIYETVCYYIATNF